jgi:hypothetical protein
MRAGLVTEKRDAIVPLYAAPESKPGDAHDSDGQAVYFRGALVGRLMQPKVGGADASFVAGSNGEPPGCDRFGNDGSRGFNQRRGNSDGGVKN